MRREKPIRYELSYKMTGVLFAAHNELGRFRGERQYADAIEKYLKLYGIGHERERVLPVSFDGESSGRNKVDFLIEDKIIVEVKEKRILGKDDYYQTKRYLVSLGKKLGILVNFRDKFLKPRRVLNSLAKE